MNSVFRVLFAATSLAPMVAARVRAIAGVNSGSLADYVSTKALKPFINKNLVAAEFVELSIP
jgi:hypothetical protein